MSAVAPIGVAIVGLGNAVAPHARALQELADRARVVWAVTRSANSARAAAASYCWPVTTDLQQAIADPAVQAVLVLTPPNAHLAIAEAAFAAGRHVLCEKPLAASLADAERLVAAGRRAGRALGTVLQMRFRPGSRRLKQVLDDGALGTVQAASVTVPWWRPQAYYDQPGRGVKTRDGGGVLITQAIHMLDLFRWCVGVSAVTAAQVRTTDLHDMETEDYAAALLRLGNGAPGTLMATVAAWPGSAETMLVIGSRGTARLEGGSLRLSWLDGREEMLMDEGGSGSGANLMGFSHAPHQAVLTDFLDAIDQGRDPAIPGEEALATQRLIDAILTHGGT
jgi:predicted dehydrogenase